MGVKIKKNIIPITIGLTIKLNNIPKLIQSLFNEIRISALIRVMIKKLIAITPKV